MPPSEPASITVSRRGSTTDDSNAECTVVWLHGEHDIATRASVAFHIARAARRDDANLLVDLSEVTFMDASTIGALVGSRNRLRTHSQSLLVRAPSRRARRVLELCGLADLIHAAPGPTVHPAGAGAALSTWVTVPTSRSRSAVVDQPVPAERLERARPLSGEPGRSPAGATIEVDRRSP